MRLSDRLPNSKSASEMFLDAANDLVSEMAQERNVELDEDTHARLRAEIIRHYEGAVHESMLMAVKAGAFRQAHEIAPDKIDSVNSGMRHWLRGIDLEM